MTAHLGRRWLMLLIAACDLHVHTWGEVCNAKSGKCSEPGFDRGCDFSVLDLSTLDMESTDLADLEDAWKKVRGKGPVLIRGAFRQPKGWAKKGKVLRMLGQHSFRIPNETKRRELGPTMAGFDTNLTDWFRRVQENDTSVPAALFTSQPQLMAPLLQATKMFEVPKLFRGVLYGTFIMVTGKIGANLPPHNHFQSWSALAHGKKFWWVVPPDYDIDSLPLDWDLDVSLERSDEIHRQIPGAKGCLQKAGEIVYLPSGYFHGTWAQSSWTFGYGGQGSNEHGDASFSARLGRTSELQEQDPSLQQIREEELLSAALRSQNPKTIEFILSRKGAAALLHEYSSDGFLPIHSACFTMSSAAIKVLLDRGAVVNSRTAVVDVEKTHKYFGPHVTPLHVCSGWGHVEAAAYLLEARADINAAGAHAPAEHRSVQDQKAAGGSTPLHYAAYAGHTSAVQQLISHRAKVDAKDLYGRTPMHFAKVNEWPEVAGVLLQQTMN
eukprot:TRINITY_DN19553_c0_g1_i1.p1 TRINITY_DN19553_c0_g1~~TRINITY_DN19553_c0_g1_i1.p1  ORF type:complete len:495 (-),score=75.89 TRINITY_DN19553_c0_g1_i1:280-1764(-)